MSPARRHPKYQVTYFYAQSKTAPILHVGIAPHISRQRRYVRDCVVAGLEAGLGPSEAMTKAREAIAWLEESIVSRSLSVKEQATVRAFNAAAIRGGGATTGMVLAQRALFALQGMNGWLQRRAAFREPADYWHLRQAIAAGLVAGFLPEDAVRRGFRAMTWLNLHRSAEKLTKTHFRHVRYLTLATLKSRDCPDGELAAQRGLMIFRMLTEYIADQTAKRVQDDKRERDRARRKAAKEAARAPSA